MSDAQHAGISRTAWNVSIEAARFDDNLYQFTLGFGWQLEIGSD